MSEYKDCSDCKRPMRSGRWKIADHPGTVVYGCNGVCNSCYWRIKHATGLPPTKPRPDVDVTQTLQSLAAYLEWRRPFRIKAGAL
jgi:hypothetical protein